MSKYFCWDLCPRGQAGWMEVGFVAKQPATGRARAMCSLSLWTALKIRPRKQSSALEFRADWELGARSESQKQHKTENNSCGGGAWTSIQNNSQWLVLPKKWLCFKDHHHCKDFFNFFSFFNKNGSYWAYGFMIWFFPSYIMNMPLYFSTYSSLVFSYHCSIAWPDQGHQWYNNC